MIIVYNNSFQKIICLVMYVSPYIIATEAYRVGYVRYNINIDTDYMLFKSSERNKTNIRFLPQKMDSLSEKTDLQR